MPKALKKLCSIKINNAFYICDETEKYIYKYIDDKYTQINSGLPEKTEKLLFYSDEAAICIFKDCILVSRSNCECWEKVNKRYENFNCCVTPCNGKVVDNHLFFLTEDRMLWKLSLFTYDIFSFPIERVPIDDILEKK